MKNKYFKKEPSVLMVVTMLVLTSIIVLTPLTITTKAAPTVLFEENFDFYDLESSMHEQGEWKGWDNNPAWTAYVTADQARSTPHSVDIVGSSNLVQEYTGADSGTWTFTAWQYIPETFAGESYFILLDDYSDGGPYHEAVQLKIDGGFGVIESDYSGEQVPLITGEWVKSVLILILMATGWKSTMTVSFCMKRNGQQGPITPWMEYTILVL